MALLGGLFGIKTGFYGTTMSMLARVKMDSAVELANKTHLAPWLALLKAHGIKNTPLSPFLHKQLLYDNALHVDGTAIEAAGFKYAVPALTAEGLRDVVLQHIAQGIFPVRGNDDDAHCPAPTAPPGGCATCAACHARSLLHCALPCLCRLACVACSQWSPARRRPPVAPLPVARPPPPPRRAGQARARE